MPARKTPFCISATGLSLACSQQFTAARSCAGIADSAAVARPGERRLRRLIASPGLAAPGCPAPAPDAPRPAGSGRSPRPRRGRAAPPAPGARSARLRPGGQHEAGRGDRKPAPRRQRTGRELQEQERDGADAKAKLPPASAPACLAAGSDPGNVTVPGHRVSTRRRNARRCSGHAQHDPADQVARAADDERTERGKDRDGAAALHALAAHSRPDVSDLRCHVACRQHVHRTAVGADRSGTLPSSLESHGSTVGPYPGYAIGPLLPGRRTAVHHAGPDTPGRFTGNSCHSAHNRMDRPISVVQRQSGESS